MKMNLTCPVRGCLVQLGCQIDPETSRILGATSCSLIDGEVDCDQECVRLMNVRWAGKKEPAIAYL